MRSCFIGLRCVNCQASFPAERELYGCAACGGPLDASYDYARAARNLTKAELAKRRGGMWRFTELLPLIRGEKPISLGEGSTPLLHATRLARLTGLESLYLKVESQNPTGSFKDRQVSTGITAALAHGRKTVVVGVSSGNVASSAGAYAARAGMESYVVSWGHIPGVGSGKTKAQQAAVYGGKVAVTREGLTPEPALAEAFVSAVKETALAKGWVPLLTSKTVNPYAVEGAKTLVFEVVESLGWQAPDWIILPVGGGSLVAETWKGIQELMNLGLIGRAPRLAAVGGPGCAVTRALEEHRETVREVYVEYANRDTLMYFSPEGESALASVRASDGVGVTLSDGDADTAIKTLARMEGIFAEPLGSWATAGAMHLAERGAFSQDAVVVLVMTGSGLKDLDRLQQLSRGFSIPEVELQDVYALDEFFARAGRDHEGGRVG